MMVSPDSQSPRRSPAAWAAAAIVGGVAPAAVLLTASAAVPVAAVLALGIMGTGMIAAATTGRLGAGIIAALLCGAALGLLAQALALSAIRDPAGAALAAMIASLSFAARGALFARSAGARGWWIALAVVAGEAAVLVTAAAMPGVWPGWVLALLPAQWASLAIQGALTGVLAPVAGAAMIALAGTAAATLLVARLWPRRWPYLVMFTTWLGASALVWERWQTAL